MKTHYSNLIDEIEKKEIINELTDLVYNNKDKESVRAYITILITSLLGGFNSCLDLEQWIDDNMGELWEDARQTIISHGNYGWSSMVKEMLKNMKRKIES